MSVIDTNDKVICGGRSCRGKRTCASDTSAASVALRTVTAGEVARRVGAKGQRIAATVEAVALVDV
jgi:hypothetical protein